VHKNRWFELAKIDRFERCGNSRLRNEVAFVKNDENPSATQLGNSTTRRERNIILLGCALLGGASAFITNLVIQVAGLRFPLLYLLITSVVGALFGTTVALIVRKHDGSPLASFAFAAFVGLVLPICQLQMLFLIFPIDP
jgi:hypothetical protein